MKRFVLYVLILATAMSARAQQSAPNIQWQKCFGGSGTETLFAGYTPSKVQLISRDKKYLFIGGTTDSPDGDMTVPVNGFWDMWVAKLDLTGKIIWKTNIDGLLDESLGSITETSDGSVLVFGTSNGDSSKAMLTKLTPDGSVVWKKYYGSSGREYGEKIIETADGNYTFIGSSEYTASSPYTSIWLGKLNKDGNLLWSKKLPRATAYQSEHGHLLEEAPNGDLYIGAQLDSSIMVAKLTGSGDTLWRKVFGSGMETIYSMRLTGPDKLTIAGYAYDVSADFPGPDLGIDDVDGYLMTFDGAGNRTFFKRFGGAWHDDIADFTMLPDQSFLITGTTLSTNGYLAGDSLLREQAWVANIAPDGRVRWARKYGGSDDDWGMTIGALSDNNYVFLGETFSNDLDVSGNHGEWDLWLAKLGSTSNLKGTVYYDDNSNNAKDATESWAHNVLVNVSKPGYDRSTTTINGQLALDLDTGYYTITAILPNYTATAQNLTITDYFQSDSISIGLKPVAGRQDLQVDLLPLGPARPGFGVSYKILYRNAGTTTVDNATVSFVNDSRLTVTGVTPTSIGGTGEGISWEVGSLAPRDSGTIEVSLRVAAPPVTNNGDTLYSYATINPASGDIAPRNNTTRLNQVVVGSYDPNDKQEASGGRINLTHVRNGEYLSYLIRFQNTGTDTAFNISVRDTLDAKLDWSTLQMISASHPYQLTITDDNKLHWQFNNILLPDSNRNEPASHGYIAYKIKAKSTAVVGDLIRNEASIYFDYNLPVVTNEFITSVVMDAPDLAITSSLSATTASVGDAVTASFNVTNSGTAAAGASKLLFYQSADAVLTPEQNGDVVLYSYSLPALAAGTGTGPVVRVLPIPCTQTPGTYYIFLVADGEYIIAESNESNNTAFNSLVVQPLAVTPASPTICTGASVSLTASGAASYTWSPATGLSATTGATVTATPTTTTTYTVTGTTNTCTATRTVTVTVATVVEPAISISYTGCPGTTLSFAAAITNGGTEPQVEWFVNNTASGTGESFTLNNAVNGMQVYARLTSTADCAAPQTVTSATETVNCITTSLPPVDGVEEVVILPNPTNGMLAVRLKLTTAKPVSFRVSDAHGREVYRTAPERLSGTTTRTLDLRKAAAGVYYLQVQVGKEVFTEKIVRAD